MRKCIVICWLVFCVTGGTDLNVINGNYNNSRTTLMINESGRRYLHIGDGTSVEFEFPQNTKGVIVISSHDGARTDGENRKQTVNVKSLDTAVLTILNVSDSENLGLEKSYLVSIRSGLAGMAPLLIQFLDLHNEANPVILEERKDYVIKVSANDDAVLRNPSGLSHFSENPVLFALLPLIFINKCAFGCKVEIDVLRDLLKQPHPVLMGIVGQFVVMPLYAYALSRIASLPKALSLGLIITCSAPGGGGGYLYSLLLGGDVTLAISMTLISTVAATGMMPLTSTIYGRLLDVHETLHVPFVKILVTLLFIAVPISTGMFIKYKFPSVSRVLLTLIRPFSFILIIGGIFMAYQMGASILANVKPQIIVVGVTVPLFGLFLGYLMAAALRLTMPHRKTVSIEIGVQNSLLALAVMQLSFSRVEADFASQAPFIVALSSTSEMLLIVIINAIYKKLRPTTQTEVRL
ncbi:P3 protein-like [Acipenser oxyrinchus oxyrinchus]|uniref:P3 protein-like n=1 Tax=Acipenser oxyrinchus oxyrinchus TaxID=40147 RepID=A0AAD8G4B3_ACIOX|nr:P3 protein-like [Acipenser oxyrinchus oxyrinchus]